MNFPQIRAPLKSIIFMPKLLRAMVVGFCGSKDNYSCVSYFKPLVGEGEVCYDNILDSF